MSTNDNQENGNLTSQEISKLKRELAALKGGVQTQRKYIETLKDSIEGYKATIKEYAAVSTRKAEQQKELEEMLRKKTNECEMLNKTIITYKDTISTYKNTCGELTKKIESLKGDLFIERTNFSYYKSLPWWKKIFK